MRDTLFIVSFGLLIYLGFATIFGDTALMGSYGAVFAFHNHKFFGYISYIYIFAFVILLYYFYKKSRVNIEKIELLIASFLLFFSSLLAQALLVKDELRGEIGSGFADFLAPYIGTFGLWTFWLIITLISLVIIFDKSAHEIMEIFFKNIKEKFSINSLSLPKEVEQPVKNKTVFEERRKSNNDAVYVNYEKAPPKETKLQEEKKEKDVLEVVHDDESHSQNRYTRIPKKRGDAKARNSNQNSATQYFRACSRDKRAKKYYCG